MDIYRLYFLFEIIHYYTEFNTPRLILQASKFNGNGKMVFNVSSDISECSAGMRTFVMVPVKLYALSLVAGSFQVVVDLFI